MKKNIITGIILIVCFSIGYSQDTSVKVNIERVKSIDGKEYASDGTLKVSINIAAVEAYYKWASTEDTIVCYLTPSNWDRESIVKAMTAYILYNNKLESQSKSQKNQVAEYLEAYNKSHGTNGN